jgi:hypothetical protein
MGKIVAGVFSALFMLLIVMGIPIFILYWLFKDKDKDTTTIHIEGVLKSYDYDPDDKEKADKNDPQ